VHTEKETIEVTGEQAQVEICGGGETIKQRRDSIQDEHCYGASQCVAVKVVTMSIPAV